MIILWNTARETKDGFFFVIEMSVAMNFVLNGLADSYLVHNRLQMFPKRIGVNDIWSRPRAETDDIH